MQDLTPHLSHATNSLPNTALLVVMPNDAWNGDKIERFLERLSTDLRHRGEKNRVQVVTQSQLEKMPTEELANRLGLAL